MKLLADGMLGRLAKWLRILGYDTVYVADADNYTVMRLARAQERLVLTRDHGLAHHTGIAALLIDSDALQDQLHQVLEHLGPPARPARSRCPVCNHALVDVLPEEVVDRVPAYVYRTNERFSWCANCEQVFWRGTHWQRMQAIVDRLRDEGGFDKITLAG
jgi:uncharacterized protein with PIN domain